MGKGRWWKMEHLFIKNYHSFLDDRGGIVKLSENQLKQTVQYVLVNLLLSEKTTQTCKEEPRYVFLYYNKTLHYGKILKFYPKMSLRSTSQI